MKDMLSRRDFVTKSAIALGAVLVCDLAAGIGAGAETAGEAFAFEEAKEKTMPHVSVKLWPGRTEEEKQRLADAIVEDVVRITGSSPGSVSVSIEDVPSGDWKEKVYEPEIRAKERFLYKKPGYSM